MVSLSPGIVERTLNNNINNNNNKAPCRAGWISGGMFVERWYGSVGTAS